MIKTNAMGCIVNRSTMTKCDYCKKIRATQLYYSNTIGCLHTTVLQAVDTRNNLETKQVTLKEWLT